MASEIDLHIHTDYSDGTKSPEEVLEIVRGKSLTGFSICDHDNLGGYNHMKKLLNDSDPELISGVELSAGQTNEDIHILGYFVNTSSDELNNALEQFRNKRNRRGADMLKKLKELGIDLSYDFVIELAGRSAIGRPNVADALVRIKAVRSFEEAFDKYIGYDRPAYVPKHNMTPEEAIELIHNAGGLAILAHPGIANAGRYIDEFLGYGLDGIEAYHPMHNSKLQKNYADFAKRMNILATGGSDYHGRGSKYGEIGSLSIPEDILVSMKKRLSSSSRG